jgi:hypothetical protein
LNILSTSPVESRDGEVEQLTRSTVLFFHPEEMSTPAPRGLVKTGIRAVKRLDATMQVYIAARPNGAAPSYALMFRLTTLWFHHPHLQFFVGEIIEMKYKKQKRVHRSS